MVNMNYNFYVNQWKPLDANFCPRPEGILR